MKPESTGAYSMTHQCDGLQCVRMRDTCSMFGMCFMFDLRGKKWEVLKLSSNK